ncbi:glycosyltransferase domain-containing protein [Vibrio sp. WXL103]|uniref:glycosyltransferase domain-containing protein n=1 Tax=Vibrio sp. WXL103 TaxID=3450710 RepID=UPI003EC55284
MKDRIALYTVLAGEYDELKPLNTSLSDNVDAFLISDVVRDVPKGWKLIVVDKAERESNLEFNRKLKIQPSLMFNNYQMTIYIDANVEVKSDLVALISEVGDSQSDLALYKHPCRSSVYDEAEEIMKRGYGYFFNINKQMNRYREESFESNALYEANIIFRKNTKLMNETMSLWWSEFSQGVKRDQLSLTYCCFKTGLNVHCLGENDARFTHKNFQYHLHLKPNPSKNALARRINRLYLKFNRYMGKLVNS